MVAKKAMFRAWEVCRVIAESCNFMNMFLREFHVKVTSSSNLCLNEFCGCALRVRSGRLCARILS